MDQTRALDAGTEPQAELALPRFDALKPLEPYLVQIRLAKLRNGWDSSEATYELSLVLEGDTLQILTEQSLSELQNIEQLTEAL